MTSNNPFASAMNGEYKHHRDPPPPPKTSAKPIKSSAPPPPPPTYDEVAGNKRLPSEYPQEKASSSERRSSRSSTKPHRSHSDSGKHQDKKGERHHKSSSKKSSSKKKSPAPHLPQNLDTIDKLDVSAFFGGGFHHDGPFDACTPHRNKNKKAAPVEAFPADGPNTSMKGPPQAASSDRLDQAFGNYGDQSMILGRRAIETPSHEKLEGTSNIPRLNPSVVAFDANEKSAPIHGPSTAGLGSTTFLNGAPAPKGDDYLAPPGAIGGGIGRKKSLVQRLRKNSASDNSSRRSSHDSSGEYRRPSLGEDESSGSLLSRVKSLKVGRK